MLAPRILWGLKKQSQYYRSVFGVLRKSTGRLTAESQGLRDAYCEKAFEKTKPIL